MRQLLLLALVGIAAWGPTTVIAGESDIPLFLGHELPSPPAQTKPWSVLAPDLPPNLRSAAALLFEQGLVDPRECEYREIQLLAADLWGDVKLLKTNAWVLPQSQPAAGRRFAVAWNGLVYPVISIGALSNLRVDVSAALKGYEDPGARVARSWNNGQHVEAESSAVLTKDILPIRAVTLLRLGEIEFAIKIWKACDWPGDGSAALGGVGGQSERGAGDPYLMLAESWAESRWRRAVCAHARGDDNLSLIDSLALAAFDKAVAKASEKRGIKRDDDAPLPDPAAAVTAPFLSSLSELPRLLADQERRAKERQEGHRSITAPDLDKVLEAVNAKYKTPDARVTALIDALQDCADQYANDGRANDWFALNPTVRALAKQGDAAVEPLLRCYESDPRLTRAVAYESTSVIGVELAAKAALHQILQKQWYGEPTPEELSAAHTDARHLIAQQMREYWAKNRGVPLLERWYRTLKDDHATPMQWAAAAGNLVQPDTEDAVVGGQFYSTDWFALHADAEGKPQGEPLRSRSDPGVSSLLRQRLRDSEAIEQLPVYRPNSPEDQRASEAEMYADQIAQAIASWDGRSAVNELREYQAYVMNKAHGRRTAKVPRVMWCYKVRFRYNDPTVFEDYSKSVKSRTAQPIYFDGGYDFLSLCEPIWTHPDDPQMSKLADWLFADSHSPWIYGRENSSPNLGPRATAVISSPLLGFPAFRGEVLAMLDDKTPVGKLDIGDNGKLMRVEPDGKSFSDRDFCDADPKAPKSGTRVEYRRCDEAAVSLSRAQGLPQIQLYWKEPDRDAAIHRCRDLLTQYGDRFRYAKDRPWWAFNGPESAALVLPVLDHPATAEDVTAGRTVFTLSDLARGHRVRTWPALTAL